MTKVIVRASALVTGVIVGLLLVKLATLRMYYVKKLAKRMDTALEMGTYDRGEIARWRDALNVIAQPWPKMLRTSKDISRDLQKSPAAT